MRDQLIPHERILAIQEALAGFVYEHAVNKDSEFYYDGGKLDPRIKY